MATKTIAIPMKFDKELFARDCQTMMDYAGLTTYDVDALIGVAIIRNVTCRVNPDYMPTLRNYVALCNALDLDPRKYLVLDVQGA